MESNCHIHFVQAFHYVEKVDLTWFDSVRRQFLSQKIQLVTRKAFHLPYSNTPYCFLNNLQYITNNSE